MYNTYIILYILSPVPSSAAIRAVRTQLLGLVGTFKKLQRETIA